MTKRKVVFQAFGHENIVGEHKTTLEITSEDFLTEQGTCIIGISANQTLDSLDEEIKTLARLDHTQITLRIRIDDIYEEIVGRGSPGLTYSNSVSMVARTSTFECDRTLMVEADKAASNLSRSLIGRLQDSSTKIQCELIFITEE